MTPPDPIIARELPLIHRIIQDETWLEGERRRCPVSEDDPVVREHVCDVIMRIGQQLRDSLMQTNPAGPEAKRGFGETSRAA